MTLAKVYVKLQLQLQVWKKGTRRKSADLLPFKFQSLLFYQTLPGSPSAPLTDQGMYSFL